ncbi:MAG: TonB-system energizer ExbB [Thermodesulfobacteriota bacterium]|nr:MAG: TonB-system energizer ExbB [Thermodesulfobacteriota bacterium]
MKFLTYLIDYGIIGILIILNIISFAIVFERLKFYKKVDPLKFTHQKELEIELTKGLSFIATTASNAPYIGLLGTVLGIMLTFYNIGHAGLIDSKKIMVGLALALKATAVGLLVAIPNSALYNYLLRKVKEKLAYWEMINGRKGI